MARENLVLGIIGDFIRRHPKMTATIAFNLGVYAAVATRKKISARDIKELPGRLVELVPSMQNISEYVPLLNGKAKPRQAARRAQKAVRQAASRAAGTASKKIARTKAHRAMVRAAKRKASR